MLMTIAMVAATLSALIATLICVLVIAQEITSGRMTARQAWGMVLMTGGVVMMWAAWVQIAGRLMG